MCSLSCFSHPHSRHSCRSVLPSLYKWPVNSPTAALNLNLLIARSSLALLGRGRLISILDCRQRVQAVHLDCCCIPNCFFMSFFYVFCCIEDNFWVLKPLQLCDWEFRCCGTWLDHTLAQRLVPEERNAQTNFLLHYRFEFLLWCLSVTLC